MNSVVGRSCCIGTSLDLTERHGRGLNYALFAYGD